MDAETCSELCQDSDVDGSEFPECRGGGVVEFLLWLGGMWVGRHENASTYGAIRMLDVFCQEHGECVSLLPSVNFVCCGYRACCPVGAC